MTTSLESWSIGKSVTSTMIGVLIMQVVHQLDQPAPFQSGKRSAMPAEQIRISGF
ncbi:hypothetical protein QTI33_07945 [Variovorax sp. J22P271]|uniref:hypothetical protein n=1 Tax=Variovorax davisae TaxID=3053515 RepID=UPI00257563F3|nr:hypothetical protein [Variovorax sp. J22P271]MDM0032073.1 hypothetical protein [Variovorax sp. J22P271]